jgi:hypothetical protein
MNNNLVAGREKHADMLVDVEWRVQRGNGFASVFKKMAVLLYRCIYRFL